MRKWLALILVGAFVTSAPVMRASSDDPELTSVSAAFSTTSNDKDHDTLLDVMIYNNRGKLLAQSRGIGGHWNDGSSNEIGLTLVNRLKKSEIAGGRVALAIHPNGNDKWEFNFDLTLTYEDETTTQKGWQGLVLTDDNSTKSLLERPVITATSGGLGRACSAEDRGILSRDHKISMVSRPDPLQRTSLRFLRI